MSRTTSSQWMVMIYRDAIVDVIAAVADCESDNSMCAREGLRYKIEMHTGKEWWHVV
jgi:hypothetical protein